MMKKLFLIATIAVAGFMNANNSISNLNFEETERTTTWTSTCNMHHATTFPDYWTFQEIAQWVSNTNTKECGVRPRNVYVNIDEGSLRIIVEN